MESMQIDDIIAVIIVLLIVIFTGIFTEKSYMTIIGIAMLLGFLLLCAILDTKDNDINFRQKCIDNNGIPINQTCFKKDAIIKIE